MSFWIYRSYFDFNFGIICISLRCSVVLRPNSNALTKRLFYILIRTDFPMSFGCFYFIQKWTNFGREDQRMQCDCASFRWEITEERTTKKNNSNLFHIFEMKMSRKFAMPYLCKWNWHLCWRVSTTWCFILAAAPLTPFTDKFSMWNKLIDDHYDFNNVS